MHLMEFDYEEWAGIGSFGAEVNVCPNHIKSQ